MEWHLYRKADKNTWPEFDCPMLMYDPKSEGEWHGLFLASWDNNIHRFVEDTFDEVMYNNELYYAYIGYVPQGYRILKPTKCNINACVHYDDGYCMGYNVPGVCQCGWEENEYAIENKRIWKEFA